MKKVVTIGGGTGQFTLLSAIKELDIDLTAVVAMTDSGGSTGKLRDEYGVLPPGDILKCLIALSDYKDAREILQTRFLKKKKLENHNAGNLLLVFLSQYLSGDFPGAVEALGEILKIKGSVLPVTTDKATLVAELENGELLYGETKIDIVKGDRSKIKKTFLVPHSGELQVYPPVVEAIKDANYIIIGPGDLYTSIIPNFLVPGVREAINDSSAKLIYVLNIMTKHGETDDMVGEEFVERIEESLGRKADLILTNNQLPTSEVLEKYKKEGSEPILLKVESDKIIKRDLISLGDLARHDSEKLKGVLKEILM